MTWGFAARVGRVELSFRESRYRQVSARLGSVFLSVFSVASLLTSASQSANQPRDWLIAGRRGLRPPHPGGLGSAARRRQLGPLQRLAGGLPPGWGVAKRSRCSELMGATSNRPDGRVVLNRFT